MKFALTYFPAFIFICIIISSCDKDQGPVGPSGQKSLLVIDSLAPGTTCSNGGITIKSGIDKNNNNKLDAEEIENSQNVCNGNNGDYDKQVIIPLYSSRYSYISGSLLYPNNILCIADFSIENYQGIDSVVLFAQFQRNFNSPGVISLYNFTDGIPVPMSEVVTDLNSSEIQKSRNFFNSFPKKKFNLGFQVSSAQESAQGSTDLVYMIMYRK